MARRVQLPESKIRRRKRVQRTRIFILLFGLLLVLLGALVGATWIPNIRIHSVALEGIQTANAEELKGVVEEKISKRYFFVVPANNIFLYPKKEIVKELLAQFPILKDATVRATNFESIVVAVVEREPRALWCGTSPRIESPCALMDENGFTFALAANFSGDAYHVYYGAATSTVGYRSAYAPKQFLNTNDFHKLSALVTALATSQSKTAVSRVVVDENSDVKVSFENGFSVIFALKDAGGDVFERYNLALAAVPFANRPIHDFEYLDLRFGDKLYYHLR
jgi:hypothetical protein